VRMSYAKGNRQREASILHCRKANLWRVPHHSLDEYS
jgi:hypothetical protein